MLVWKFCHWCEFLLLQLPLPPLPLPLVEKVTVKPLAPAEVTRRSSPSTNAISSSVSVFTIASLQQYTNSFSEGNFIGEGLLGSVYKAELPGGKVQIHLTDMKWFSRIAIWLFNWFGPQAWLFYVPYMTLFTLYLMVAMWLFRCRHLLITCWFIFSYLQSRN